MFIYGNATPGLQKGRNIMRVFVVIADKNYKYTNVIPIWIWSKALFETKTQNKKTKLKKKTIKTKQNKTKQSKNNIKQRKNQINKWHTNTLLNQNKLKKKKTKTKQKNKQISKPPLQRAYIPICSFKDFRHLLLTVSVRYCPKWPLVLSFAQKTKRNLI